MAIRVIAVDFWKCNNPSRVSPVDDVHRRMAPRFFPPLLPAFFFNIGFALVFFVFIFFLVKVGATQSGGHYAPVMKLK